MTDKACIIYGYNELPFNKFLQDHGEGFLKKQPSNKDIESTNVLNQTIKQEVKIFNDKIKQILSELNVDKYRPSSLPENKLKVLLSKQFAKSTDVKFKELSKTAERNSGIVDMKESSDRISPGSRGSPRLPGFSGVSGSRELQFKRAKHTKMSYSPAVRTTGAPSLSLSRKRPRSLRSLRSPGRSPRSHDSPARYERRLLKGGISTIKQSHIEEYRKDYLKALYLVDAFHDFSKDADFQNYILKNINIYPIKAPNYLYLDVLRYFTGTSISSGARHCFG
jgi:hypothetical protein